MYAELVINIQAPLKGTFHYFVPHDLELVLQVGHLVEVEFGRRLAQGVVIALSDVSPVEETKPVIALIDADPVVLPEQLRLAEWMAREYLAPLNACVRLLLPPGLTRWSDMVLELEPSWDGGGPIGEKQRPLVEFLREKGVRRGRQIKRALGKKSGWEEVARQLLARGIVRRGSVLDPPGVQPKVVRAATLIAGFRGQLEAARQMGRPSKAADLLVELLGAKDPLVDERVLLERADAGDKHLEPLLREGIVVRVPAESWLVAVPGAGSSDETLAAAVRLLPMPLSAAGELASELITLGLARVVPQPDVVGLAVSRANALDRVWELRRGETYARVISFLAVGARPVPVGEIYAATGCNLRHLRRLVDADVLRLVSKEVWRDPLADKDFVPAVAPSLTRDQAAVWSRVRELMEHQAARENPADGDGEGDAEQVVLLHGVTGSGKTEIYMRAIDHALERGQRAIVLVPEIALTPQTVRRFAARFPGRVAVLHSGLTAGERYDTWRRGRSGQYDIVIGPRSALFTPLDGLGVIVVDEEHDDSYKNTTPLPPPYYHAREAAVELGRLCGAVVVLGSATPDLVSYHRARGGRHLLLELPRRVMGHRERIAGQADRYHVATPFAQLPSEPEAVLSLPLPPVRVVDLRQELRAGNRSIFSRALADAVTETLGRGEQAILFLNRRGTATFVICRDCGHVLKCPRCGVPLTYHRPGAMLVCHHCGRRETPPDRCPECASTRIRYFGLGTEEVEQRVRDRWPEARVTRWDSDTTAGRDRHEELLARFVDGESDILIGTQMIAKGLDLPLVTLVGVISADVSLGLPDYRTGERAFQVLAQVAGRAGRGLLGGRVILQTYQPDHYAVQAAAEHDYAAFFLEEIAFRTRHMLPPFRRLAKLVFTDPVAERGRRQAERVAARLRKEAHSRVLASTDILGPAPPFFGRYDGRFRWQIIVRSPDPARLLADFALPKGWSLDIDPVSTL